MRIARSPTAVAKSHEPPSNLSLPRQPSTVRLLTLAPRPCARNSDLLCVGAPGIESCGVKRLLLTSRLTPISHTPFGGMHMGDAERACHRALNRFS